MAKNKPYVRTLPTVIDEDEFRAAARDPKVAEFLKAANEAGRKLSEDGRDFSRAPR